MFLYNNSNCLRKSAHSIFLSAIQNLSPLQSSSFSFSVKTYEEKLKITLLGTSEDLVRLTLQSGIRSLNFFLWVYLQLRIDFSLLLLIILQT